MDTVNHPCRAIVGEGTSEATWQEWLRRTPLQESTARDLARGSATVHIVSPHPDDEVLGCAGIMRQLSRLGVTIRIWSVTDGEASHPGSRRWPPALLAATRARESQRALRRLAVRARRERLSFPDGSVAGHEPELARRLARAFAPGDTVMAPWRLDGHPDHEATARASHIACAARGCRLLEFPIWGWHWADPLRGEFPASRAISIALDTPDLQAKANAIRAFRSQLEGDPDTGSGPILPASALDRLLRPFEVVLL